MRLSLRTLLAFEDNTFDIEQQRQLERIIPGDDAASETIQRIREVVRNPFLGVPGVVDGQEELDSNLVAAYLDHQMPAKFQDRFESHCLSSDKYLAEIACVHQVLSTVLGEPARTGRECRLRCYELYQLRDEIEEEADFKGYRIAPGKEPDRFRKEIKPLPAEPAKAKDDRKTEPETDRSAWKRFWRRLFAALVPCLLLATVLFYRSAPVARNSETPKEETEIAGLFRSDAIAPSVPAHLPEETILRAPPPTNPLPPAPPVPTPPAPVFEVPPVPEPPARPVVQVSAVQVAAEKIPEPPVEPVAEPVVELEPEPAAPFWNTNISDEAAPALESTEPVSPEASENPPETPTQDNNTNETTTEEADTAATKSDPAPNFPAAPVEPSVIETPAVPEPEKRNEVEPDADDADLTWPSNFEQPISEAGETGSAVFRSNRIERPAAAGNPVAPVPPTLARPEPVVAATSKRPETLETVFSRPEPPTQSRIEFHAPRQPATPIESKPERPSNILPVGGVVEKRGASHGVLGRMSAPKDSSIVFSAASASSPWKFETEAFELFADQYVLTVAPFRSVLSIGDKFQVEMIGDAKLCLSPPNELGIPGIFVDYGRLVVRRAPGSDDSGVASLRIQTEKAGGTVQIKDRESIVFVDTFAEIVETPGKDADDPASTKPNPILGLIPAPSQTILWTAGGKSEPTIARRETSILLSSERSDPGSILHTPRWLHAEPLGADWRRLAEACRRIFGEFDNDCESALQRLVRDDSVAVRSLGFRLWGDLGRFDVPLTYFSVAENAEEPVRQILVAYFREVMKRDEETVQRLADAIDSVRR